MYALRVFLSKYWSEWSDRALYSGHNPPAVIVPTIFSYTAVMPGSPFWWAPWRGPSKGSLKELGTFSMHETWPGLRHAGWQILSKQRNDLEELDKNQPDSISTYLLSASQRLIQYHFWSTLRENWGLWEDTWLSGDARYMVLDLVTCRAPFEWANTQRSAARLFPSFSENQQEAKSYRV